MKTLILGMGNPILTDDGIGIKVAHRFQELNPEVTVIETSEAGFGLLDLVTGYDRLIIIDSIKTGRGNLGEVYQLELDDLHPAKGSASSHGTDIATAFTIGKGLGCPMPESVSIYAIEINDNTTFGESCTEELEKKIPEIARQIREEAKL